MSRDEAHTLVHRKVTPAAAQGSAWAGPLPASTAPECGRDGGGRRLRLGALCAGSLAAALLAGACSGPGIKPLVPPAGSGSRAVASPSGAEGGPASSGGRSDGASRNQDSGHRVHAMGLAAPRAETPEDGFGAAALGPDPNLTDAVVARIGTTEVRRSHIYEAFLLAQPELTGTMLDMVVGDVLMAGHAEEFGIAIPREWIEPRVDQEIEVIRQAVESQYDGAVSFEDYIKASFAVDPDGFRQQVRRRQVVFALRGLVVRYLALRDGQVEVRVLRHKDRQLVEELQSKASGGADFASLVKQYSQDPSRVDGGLLPPFGPGFAHPVAGAALALEPGQLTQVISAEGEDGMDHYLAICLRRQDGRDVPFAAVEEELWEELVKRPLSPFEFNAYLLRFRGALEVGPLPAGGALQTGPLRSGALPTGGGAPGG